MTSFTSNNLKTQIQGVIIHYSDKKFGTILGDDTKQYYFYWKDFKSRADVQCIHKGARVEFEPDIDAKRGSDVARHCHLLDTSHIKTYATPKKIFESKTLDTGFWDVFQLSDDVLNATAESKLEALNKLKENAVLMGANALLEIVISDNSKDDEKIYCATARPAVLGQKDVNGEKLREELKM